MPLSDILAAWNQFFHAPVCCASLVLFRILTGLILVTNALLLIPLTEEYFGEAGAWNTKRWRKQFGQRRFSILTYLPDSTNSFRVLLAVHLTSALGFLFGYLFHLSALITFLTLVSIHHRNTFILSSGDTLLRIFTFLSIFSDASAAVSIDSWLAGNTFSEFPAVAAWPIRLIQLQMSIIYLRTVFWKLRGRRWRDGTAAWYPLWVESYVRFRPPTWMLNRGTIRFATWGTLIAEVALGTLIWIREFRYPVLGSGILLHLIFDLILNLQFFSWIMIAGLVLFVAPEDVIRLLNLF